MNDHTVPPDPTLLKPLGFNISATGENASLPTPLLGSNPISLKLTVKEKYYDGRQLYYWCLQ